MRRVLHEDQLLDALHAQWGDDVVLFVGSDMSAKSQIETFKRARLILGPHGAGMWTT